MVLEKYGVEGNLLRAMTEAWNVRRLHGQSKSEMFHVHRGVR